MKILISTPVFKPMVGGMEVLANNFAVHLTNRGHEVTLVTPIAAEEPDDAIYPIVRQPSGSKFYQLVKDADLVFSNGASLYCAPWSIIARKPVVMRHTGYQVAAIDGAGWYNGKLAPLRPIPSFLHHIRHGQPGNTIRGIFKVTALRLFAKHFVAANVAISDWMMKRHPLPNQLRIHNPFPIVKFVDAVNTTGEYTYDFFFLGRLVTEKGVDLLMEAFARVQEQSGDQYKLCIIGKGPEHERLEAIAARTGQTKNVYFAGIKTQRPLIELLRKCNIGVLPSTWEEPFGGVSTELLAAGKNLIVSRDGALSEIVADAGLSFPNNDIAALTDAMLRLVRNPELQTKQKENGRRRLKDFDEERLIDDYVALFHRIIKK